MPMHTLPLRPPVESGTACLDEACSYKDGVPGCRAGVRVAPTFQLYKKSDKVAEMTGAKVEELQKLIDEHK